VQLEGLIFQGQLKCLKNRAFRIVDLLKVFELVQARVCGAQTFPKISEFDFRWHLQKGLVGPVGLV
jgi:hypothetical protein